MLPFRHALRLKENAKQSLIASISSEIMELRDKLCFATKGCRDVAKIIKEKNSL